MMRLHFRATGQGFPFIILHGFLGSLDNWRTVSRRLALDFKVFSLDLRNHGQSLHSEVMNYQVMAQDVLEFMDEQSLSTAILLGHSMGGKVAMQFASTWPEQVHKLIVVDIAPKAYPPTHRSVLAALHALDLKGFASFREIDAALAPVISEATARHFLLKNLSRTTNRGFRWKIALESIIKSYEELTKPVNVKQAFNGPTCFIRGGRSRYVEDDDVPLIREMFPRAEVVTIASAGHWVHADAQEEFILAVNDFLTRQ